MTNSVGALRPYPNTVPDNLAGVQSVLQTITNIRLNDSILWQALCNQSATNTANIPSGTTGTGSAVLQTSPTINTPLILGVTDGSNAPAGYIGEYVSGDVPIGSAVNLISLTPTSITSISLTAGDWDVWGQVTITTNASATATNHIAWIGTTTGSFPPTDDNFPLSHFPFSMGASNAIDMALAPKRMSITSTTTYYLEAYDSFSGAGAACTAYGRIEARRVR